MRCIIWLLTAALLVDVSGLSFSPAVTLVRPACKVDGKSYHVGQSFIQPSCKGRCTCLVRGGIKCATLCPPMRGMCSFGLIMTSVKVALPNSKCMCPRLRCLKRKCPPCAMDDIRCNAKERIVSYQVHSKLLRGCSCKRHKCVKRALGPCATAVYSNTLRLNRGLLGAFVPRCKPDGSYQGRQCHGSTGQCWCVDSNTGKEIRGSRKSIIGSRRKPKCALGPCATVYSNTLRLNRRVLGAFVPRCKPDGSYQGRQCHGSTGQCWCVDSNTGKEIRGSRSGPGRRKPKCGLCFCPKIRCMNARVARTGTSTRNGCTCPKYKCVRYTSYKSDCTSGFAVGRCEGYLSRWHYDSLTNSCNRFTYCGCGGNGNNFKTRSQCMSTCGRTRFTTRWIGGGRNWRWSLSVHKD